MQKPWQRCRGLFGGRVTQPLFQGARLARAPRCNCASENRSPSISFKNDERFEQIGRQFVFTAGGQSGPLRVGQRGAMCEKCIEIDRKIERYRRIQQSILDQYTVDQTKQLVADLEAQKAALHPEQG
jgi:hypothetical protein